MTDDERSYQIQSHMQMAGHLARRFAASHPRMDSGDLEQLAYLALVRAVDSYKRQDQVTIEKHVACEINRDLVDEAHKWDWNAGKSAKGRKRKEVTISLHIIGTAEGPPMNSILDLRSARSLNPRADIDALTREAIGEVRAAAIIQSSPEHPDHEFYAWTAELSRKNVDAIRERLRQMALRRRDRAMSMPDVTSNSGNQQLAA